MRKKKLNRAFLAFVKLTGALPAAILYKPRVFYAEPQRQRRRLPRPCILISNHTSLLDFPLYLLLFPFRTLRFQIAEVLFHKSPALSWLLYRIGGIFVDRDARDFGFVGETLEILDAGGTVGIFPQSRLPDGPKPFPFLPSIAYIALHSDAPIVPAYTDGCYGLKKRTHVMLGAPIRIRDVFPDITDKPEDLTRVTEYLEETVRALKRQLVEKIGETERRDKPSV